MSAAMVINNLYFNPDRQSTPDRARLLNDRQGLGPGHHARAARQLDRQHARGPADEDLLRRRRQISGARTSPRTRLLERRQDLAFRPACGPVDHEGEVADFIRKQTIDQDLQRARRLGTFLTTGALEQVEIDLADFTTKAARGDRVSMYGWEQGGPVPRYALVAVDNFSKKLAAIPCGQQGRRHDRAGSRRGGPALGETRSVRLRRGARNSTTTPCSPTVATWASPSCSYEATRTLLSESSAR
jgi:hypothetical protein